MKSYQTIILKVPKWLEEWLIKPVDGHFINISRYNSLNGKSYFELPKDLDHPRKGLINI